MKISIVIAGRKLTGQKRPDSPDPGGRTKWGKGGDLSSGRHLSIESLCVTWNGKEERERGFYMKKKTLRHCQ